ncbi:MAG: diphthamide synthesis protein [Nanoarchaeota archaeon]|nr:diphthamide synthesis protein [Nanoarchaeota archaeon]
MTYNLEPNKAVKEIKNKKAKTVLIQLPDGLKPKAKEIADFIENNTNAKCFIWMGSCYGACDIPNVKDFDLLIQWGHSEFRK